VTNEEFRKLCIASFVASATGSVVLGTLIFLGWISPLWIFLLPFAIFIAGATYYTVRLVQITRAERAEREPHTDATPRPRAT
jgi:hypothetical protein